MSKIVRLVGLKENGIEALTSAWVSANDLPWIVKEYEAKWFPLRVVLLESDEEVPWGISHDYESFDEIRTAATRKMLDENAALRARIAELEKGCHELSCLLTLTTTSLDVELWDDEGNLFDPETTFNRLATALDNIQSRTNDPQCPIMGKDSAK